jgi:hypothetical protein
MCLVLNPAEKDEQEKGGNTRKKEEEIEDKFTFK